MTQKVQLYYDYGIRYQKTILNRVCGVPKSIRALQMDPLGEVPFFHKFHVLRSPQRGHGCAPRTDRRMLVSFLKPRQTRISL